MALSSAILLAEQSVERGAWRWATAFGVASVILPSMYVGVQVYRGKISDVHVPLREERIRPFIVAAASAILVLAVFVWWPAPPVFRMLALANALQAVVFFVITLRWKISLHSAAAAGLTVVGISALSASGALLVLTVPVVAWSRVRLHRHTLAQTICGAALGGLIAAFALWVVK